MGRPKKAVYVLWRATLERFAAGISLIILLLLADGFFRHVSITDWVQGGAIIGLALLLIAYAVGGRAAAERDSTALDQLELAALLLSALAVAVQIVPWAQGALYLAVALLVGFNRRSVGLAVVAWAIALEVALHFGSGELPGRIGLLAQHLAYVALFAFAHLLFLQVDVARRRRQDSQRVSLHLAALEEEARQFRLGSGATRAGAGRDRVNDEAKMARSAVLAIHQGLFFMLELLKQALDLQTCVLLWLDDSGERLSIKELVTESSLVHELPIPARAGALGGIVKNRVLLNLQRLSKSQQLPYYQGPEIVGAFVGVPVLDGQHLRGVLCADRRDARAFSALEEKLLIDASAQILRAIDGERVFNAVERSKYEHERFYRASSLLNGALTLSQVYDTAIAAAGEIAQFDFAAVTLFDTKRNRHTICRAVGPDAESLEGESFGSNAGLVSMVVKNKHFLPATDSGTREREMMLFTRKLKTRPMNSLLVLPLIVHDVAVGTFVIAAQRSGALSKETREMLGVITNQVAVSIENAKMFKRMEEMATTDGLTSLPNHRAFQTRFSEMLDRAERHGKPVALVITDVDKFKSVNDTYGHPVGDAVLRRVSAVLAAQIRKVDQAARYGGEEFALVLEETDADGARLLCERIREEIAAQVMSSEQGPFRVTLSLGIASYPADGVDKQQLIERADQALYFAKQNGRNRTVTFRQANQGQRAAG